MATDRTAKALAGLAQLLADNPGMTPHILNPEAFPDGDWMVELVEDEAR